MLSQNPNFSEYDVSVIVPTYNDARYLPSSLNSIRELSFDGKLQVIVINDGSADDTQKVVEEFRKKNLSLQIEYIEHKGNKGLSVARNSGLEMVQGKYFTFLDSDDLLTPDSIGVLFSAAEENLADIVKGNNWLRQSDKKQKAHSSISRKRVYHRDEILSLLFEHKAVRGHTWAKLFRSESCLRFRNLPGHKMAQDLIYCAEIFSQANKMVLIPEFVYTHNLRDTSVKGKKYESGSYLYWLKAIEACNKYNRSKKTEKSYKSLKAKTLLQLAKECEKLPTDHKCTVYREILNRKQQWKVSILDSLENFPPKLSTLFRIIKLNFQLNKLSTEID